MWKIATSVLSRPCPPPLPRGALSPGKTFSPPAFAFYTLMVWLHLNLNFKLWNSFAYWVIWILYFSLLTVSILLFYIVFYCCWYRSFTTASGKIGVCQSCQLYFHKKLHCWHLNAHFRLVITAMFLPLSSPVPASFFQIFAVLLLTAEAFAPFPTNTNHSLTCSSFPLFPNLITRFHLLPVTFTRTLSHYPLT